MALLVIPFSGFTNSFATHNPNLFVSSEDPLFQNYFAGPQVIEVVVSDPDIQNVTQPVGEPDVTVNGKKLRMAQATDGNWYGYFADKSQAQIADSTAGVAGKGLDFGAFCSNMTPQTTFGVSFSETTGFAIARTVGISGEQNGTASLLQCTGSIQPSSIRDHVVREAKNLNTNPAVPPGQIGLDPLAWPVIQLYDFAAGGNVVVTYNKGGSTQTTTLTFDVIPSNLIIVQDGTVIQTPGSSVLVQLADPQLNIDPTDEDSWTWGTEISAGTVFYQAFDENGNIDADGVVVGGISAMQDLSSFLTSMMFYDNGVLSMNNNTLGSPVDVLNLDDNGIQVLFHDDHRHLRTISIPHEDLPVTLVESSMQSKLFRNIDMFGDTNIDVSRKAQEGSQATITYNEKNMTIIVVNP